MDTVGVNVIDILKRFGVTSASLIAAPTVSVPNSHTGRVLLYDGDGAWLD